MMRRPEIVRLSLVMMAVAVAVTTGSVQAQQTPARGGAPQPAPARTELKLLPVQGNVYLVAGLDANVTVLVGKAGLLFVDTPPVDRVDEVLALVRNVNPSPIRYVIVTAVDGAHIGGTEALVQRGERLNSFLITGAIDGPPVAAGGAATGVTVLGHENVLNRLTAATSQKMPGAMLTAEYFMPTKDFSMNGDPIIVEHAAAAHTDGDSFVLFRKSDVLSVGDLFSPGRYPEVDIARGGSINGLIAGVNRLLEITIPASFQEGGTYVIPGHGRICDEADLSEYREMLTVIRDRVQDMIRAGKTLQEVRAARPSLDYDVTYGQGGPTGQAFVDAVYKSLTAPTNGAGER